MKPSVDYLIAAWFGQRKYLSPLFKNDRLTYLRRHFQALEKLSTSFLRNIVVLIASDKGKDTDLENEIVSLSQRNLTIATKENVGMSYGSWKWYHDSISDRPDYYMLMEDDYVVLIDHFDRILIDELRRKEVDYICGDANRRTPKSIRNTKRRRINAMPLVAKMRAADNGFHASMSCGLLTREAMDRLDYRDLKKDWAVQPKFGVPQVMFSTHIILNGGKIGDITDSYSVGCRYFRQKVPIYGDPNNPRFFMPLL